MSATSTLTVEPHTKTTTSEQCTTQTQQGSVLRRSLTTETRESMHNLSNEIFERILVEAVQPDTDFEPTSWKTHVQLTAVCRLWREVLLGCPEFWAGVPLRPCQRLPEMLARSKDKPKSIRLDMKKQPIYYSVLQQLSSAPVAEFHMLDPNAYSGSLDLVMATGKVLPEGEDPVLRSLKLSPAEVERFVRQRLPTVSTKFLSSQRPNLQYLTLMGCTVDWSALRSATDASAGFRNLLTLHLKYVRPPPSTDILTSILRSSPSLQTLRIFESIPEDIGTTEPASIPLRSLVLCHLSDHLQKVSELLFSLDLAEDARIACVVLDDVESPHVMIGERAFEAAAPKILNKCHISLENPDQMGAAIAHLHGFEGGEFLGDSSSCTLSRVSASGEDVELRRVDGPAAAFLHMQRLLHAPRITTLRISWANKVKEYPKVTVLVPKFEDWHAFYARHTSITDIQFELYHDFDKTHSLIMGIHPQPPVPGRAKTSTTTVPLLPNLRRLSFKRLGLSPWELEMINDIVVAKSRAGTPLEYVKFEECINFETLEKAVAEIAKETKVVWDRYVWVESEDSEEDSEEDWKGEGSWDSEEGEDEDFGF